MEAGRHEPLDADLVADVDVGHQLALLDYYAGAFVTTDHRGLARQGPVVVERVQVGVADARVFDVNEDFVVAGGGNRDFFVGDYCVLVLVRHKSQSSMNWVRKRREQRTTILLSNLRPLLLGDVCCLAHDADAGARMSSV